MFLAALIGIPVIEITVFVEVGGEIGALNTIILTVLTAIAGMALLRHQGISVLMQAQATLNKGESPVNEILNGILLAIAGLFLLIPGFVTDGIGFLLFLPPFRSLIASWLGRNVKLSGHSAHGHFHQHSRRGSSDTPLIDGEYEVVNDKPKSEEELEKLENQAGSPDENSPWSKNK